jgi:two-component system sensor histidine kinase MtrB
VDREGGKYMKSWFAGFPVRSLSIRMLVVLWAGSVLLAWAGLVGGWFIAKNRLSKIDQRITLDAEALDAAHKLESDVLAERYNDLLWKATGQGMYKQQREEYLQAAEQIAANLSRYITTEQEREVSIQIEREMNTLREQSQPSTLAPSQSEPLLASLLSAVRLFDTQNEMDVQRSLLAADGLHGQISDWAIALSLATAGLLFAGSFSLVNRVVRPALALTASSHEFGQGNLTTRATVLHDDELGSLARTFNNMADDIAHREQDRLQFVAMIVHDLKSPALAIELGARMLRGSWGAGQPANAQEITSLLEDIGEEAKRLRTIIHDLTDDIQVASGRFVVNKVRVDLGRLVRRLIHSQAQAFSDHRIVVENGQACTVLGDADRLERVVQNLVSNAVKYSPRDTQITVRIERKEPFALLAVCDQGQGISLEDQKILFQPFGRGRSTERLAEGTGMGLYVVKQIIEAHGGQITVQSRPGQGTTFQIQLPLV